MNKTFQRPLIKSIILWASFMISLNVAYILSSFLPRPLTTYALGLFGAGFAVLCTYLVLKIDQKTFADVGLRWEKKSFLRFFQGLVPGLVVLFLIVLAIHLFTDMKIGIAKEVKLIDAILLSSLALLPQAWMEEVAFRAYPIATLQKRYNIRLTVYITAIAFALYHFIPSGNFTLFGLIGAFIGTGVWGIIYAILAIQSKGIALPTGFHLGLNLGQAIFGMKQPYRPVWELSKQESNNPLEMDQVGLIVQIIVLIAGILMVEMYIRKNASKEYNPNI